MLDDADFTPNADRAIWIDGEINNAIENRLRPEILKLTSCSREPITVFIDSDGGSPAVGKRVLNLLRSTNQVGASPCRIITVAVSKALSTAADILSAGDFAIADPGCKLLYHGTRITAPRAVTADYASRLADFLKTSNRRFASSFLDKSAQRFMFLFVALRGTFDEAHLATDLDCFQEMLCRKASPAAQRVLRQAGAVRDHRLGLVAHFQEHIAKVRVSSGTADMERAMLDVSIAFEYASARADAEWSLRTGGLGKINDHFFYLDEYFQRTNAAEFAALCERWGPIILAKDERDVLSAEEQAERFRAFFLPFWSFFVELYHALQRADNELTAMDAFWLGLIDTLSYGPWPVRTSRSVRSAG